MIVRLANSNSFDCQEGCSILSAASQNGVVLEHSCRTGRCGVCKAKVLSGQTVPLIAEESLSESDKENGFILTCCRAVTEDTDLDIEDLGELAKYKVKTLPCRIDSMCYLTDNVIEVSLRTPPQSVLKFLPGQYVNIIGRSGLRRSYSIANAPRKDGKITLQIRKVDKGAMSKYWFEDAQVHDLLRLEGPLGTFSLRESSASTLVLLATGTGIAPIKAILEQMSASPNLNKFDQIYLYWGGRSKKDVYWKPSFDTLPLKFNAVLSRDESWNGLRGYVQDAVLSDGHDLRNSVVYACGSEVMISSAFDTLVTRGLDHRHYYSDSFVSSS